MFSWPKDKIKFNETRKRMDPKRCLKYSASSSSLSEALTSPNSPCQSLIAFFS
jgi:hypothetical protein